MDKKIREMVEVGGREVVITTSKPPIKENVWIIKRLTSKLRDCGYNLDSEGGSVITSIKIKW